MHPTASSASPATLHLFLTLFTLAAGSALTAPITATAAAIAEPTNHRVIYRYRLSDAPNPTHVFDPATFANPRMDQNPLTIVTSYSLASHLQGNDGTAAMNLYPDSNGDMILWTADYDPSLTRKILGFKLNADGSLQTPASRSSARRSGPPTKPAPRPTRSAPTNPPGWRTSTPSSSA